MEYEVKDKDGGSFHINLANKTCSCNAFQTLQIPCSHAIAAAIMGKKRVDTFVSEVYSLKSLAAAYEEEIYPISKMNPTESEGSSSVNMDILPPATRRPPGRPRKTRILSAGEIKVSKTYFTQYSP